MNNNTMCQGVDTGFDPDPTCGAIIVHCDIGAVEMSVLAQLGASLSVAKDAMIILGSVFEEEKKSMKDLSINLELIMRDLKLKDIERIRYEPKEYPQTRIRLSVPQTRIRLSVPQTRIRLSVPQTRIRLWRPDSRSGMKGKTIKRRLGKL